MTDPLAALPHDQAMLVSRFFMTFARFEFAMKGAGWWSDGGGGAATADWGCVSEHLREAPREEKAALIEAGRLLLDRPPKKQAVVKGRLEWIPALDPGDDASQLSVYIRRVRNNLFHGGKCLPEPVLRPRSLELLNAALTVLRALIDVTGFEDVRHHFDAYAAEEW